MSSDRGSPARSDVRLWIETVDNETPGFAVNDPQQFYDAFDMVSRGETAGFRQLAAVALNYADDLGVEIVQKAIKTNRDKGHDYTGGSLDILKNFYKVAGMTRTTPLQTWGVYVAKHLDAIETYMMTGRVASEPIESRLVDVLVYAALGHFIAIREGA